ncbi:sugar phosphorylase [Microvirga solisilvae]|uniref:sugar phosphorylase n=1 Tax=Microvirga solisilvae TaxID=2919498 RepID=UPI001FAF5762|nr:sugar phosphorylase [Microvirga solisilvae]
MAQTLRDFLKVVENLPPDTLLCVAEVDEAFAAHVEELEIVEDAKPQDNRKPESIEAVELGNGKQTVLVIRW